MLIHWLPKSSYLVFLCFGIQSYTSCRSTWQDMLNNSDLPPLGMMLMCSRPLPVVRGCLDLSQFTLVLLPIQRWEWRGACLSSFGGSAVEKPHITIVLHIQRRQISNRKKKNTDAILQALAHSLFRKYLRHSTKLWTVPCSEYTHPVLIYFSGKILLRQKLELLSYKG